MAHQVETMFYVGQVPWHGLGEKLDQPPTSQEAIVQAGLDWEVEAHPIYARQLVRPFEAKLAEELQIKNDLVESDYDHVLVPDGQVVRRMSDGRVLGVVGPRWTPVQNRDAFEFFDPLVQDGLALYHTAGSLQGGRTVWILAQIGETRHIIGEDRVGQFLLLSMGHDGQRSIQIMPTPIRVVCANTLSMAESAAEQAMRQVRIAHTMNAKSRLDQLQGFLRPYLASFDETMEVFTILARAQLKQDKVDAYLQELFPDPTGEDANTAFAERVRAAILAKFEGDLLGYDAIPEQFKRTYWTLYNAVTEYVDHDRGTDKHRLNSCWLGSGKQLKEKALALALA